MSALTFTFLSWVADDERDEDDDGPDEVEFELPGKYHVCSTCEGTGRVLMAGLRGVAITEEDRDRDWSPDEWEQYTSGGYDVDCETCEGKRVVLGPDREACARNADDKATLARYDIDCRRKAEEARQIAHEIRMGY